MNTDIANTQRRSQKNLSARIRLNLKAAANTAAASLLKRIQGQCRPFTPEDWHRLEFRKEYPRKRYFGEDSL